MKIKLLFLGVLFLLSGCTSNQADILYKRSPAFYSYIFGDVQSNRIIKEHRSSVYTSPASCQKVITALLAYKTLGADYRYETRLYVTKLHGKMHNIIISFSGDPTLKTEDLLQLLEPIKRSHITGKIFLDITEFKTSAHSSNIMVDDVGTDYAQPVSSINIDENLIRVTTYPSRENKRALITNNAHYFVDSTITTSSAATLINLSMKNNRIYADGNINSEDFPREMEISPTDFDYFILKRVKQVFKKINIKNEIVFLKDVNKVPTNKVLLNVFKSDFLSNIITKAIKKSDNFVFDAIYLKLIHLYGDDKVKKWEDGDEVIKKLIRKYFDVEMDKAKFVDGSGLSRYNQIQPSKIYMMLKQGYNLKEFVSALPSPGEPGSTLAKRKGLVPYVKAKTGNMSGISCLCGYGVSKKPRVFVVITNSFAPPAKKIFPLIDNFVNYFIEKN